MNLNEQMLQKLINDPSLIKMLEKMVSNAPREKKEKHLKELGHPAYVNQVECKCKLCGSTHIIYMCMSYDSTEKLYRGSCHHLDNVWPGLPIYKMVQRRATCNACPGILSSLPVETLISKLIALAENNIVCNNGAR